jgi:hypothetical protein
MHFIISNANWQLIFVYALCAFVFLCMFIYIWTAISLSIIICSSLVLMSDGSTCIHHCMSMLSACGSVKILWTGGSHNIFLEINPVIDYCVFCYSYPERDELKTIYSIYMSSIMGMCLPKHQIWKSSTKIGNLTGSMIKIYEEVLADIFVLYCSGQNVGFTFCLEEYVLKLSNL